MLVLEPSCRWVAARSIPQGKVESGTGSALEGESKLRALRGVRDSAGQEGDVGLGRE